MIDTRGGNYINQLNILGIIAFYKDDGVAQIFILNGYIKLVRLFINYSVKTFKNKDKLHKIGASAAGPIPIALKLKLALHSAVKTLYPIHVVFIDGINVALFIGKGLKKEHIVMKGNVPRVYTVYLLKGHVNVKKHRMKIYGVTNHRVVF